MESLGTEAREERLGAREERLEAREERLEAKERVENRKEGGCNLNCVKACS